MKMRLKDGKRKVLTLSYDDAVVQDIRLVEILNKYGIKATFNVNSGLYLGEDAIRETYKGRMKKSEAIALYKNSPHEVAVHTLSHPFFDKLDTAEMIYEVIEDRKAIEEDYGTIARGMAYPHGGYNDKAIDVLEKCHIAYARTVKATHSFSMPENWLALHPTCHHTDEKLRELIEKFVEKPSYGGNAQMFYLWGHSYEFDDHDNWDIIEKFCEYAGGRDYIWYATNIEIYDYVKAYEGLQTSFDKKIIHNPSDIDVWVEVLGQDKCIKAGETLYL